MKNERDVFDRLQRLYCQTDDFSIGREPNGWRVDGLPSVSGLTCDEVIDWIDLAHPDVWRILPSLGWTCSPTVLVVGCGPGLATDPDGQVWRRYRGLGWRRAGVEASLSDREILDLAVSPS